MITMINLLASFFFIPLINLTIDAIKPEILEKEARVYFTETAFHESIGLVRWEESIKIQLTGKFSPADKKQIENLIEEVRPLIGKVSIEMVSDHGNLIFHFDKDLQNFNSKTTFKNEQVPFGYMKPQLDKSYQIFHADVYIHPFIKGDKKSETIKHEFCHSLGLLSHANRAFFNHNLLGKIIYSDNHALDEYKTDDEIPTLDKEAIKILYGKKVRLGMTKQKFSKM